MLDEFAVFVLEFVSLPVFILEFVSVFVVSFVLVLEAKDEFQLCMGSFGVFVFCPCILV